MPAPSFKDKRVLQDAAKSIFGAWKQNFPGSYFSLTHPQQWHQALCPNETAFFVHPIFLLRKLASRQQKVVNAASTVFSTGSCHVQTIFKTECFRVIAMVDPTMYPIWGVGKFCYEEHKGEHLAKWESTWNKDYYLSRVSGCWQVSPVGNTQCLSLTSYEGTARMSVTNTQTHVPDTALTSLHVATPLYSSHRADFCLYTSMSSKGKTRVTGTKQVLLELHQPPLSVTRA